jgi:hypothetical protein
MTTKPKSALQSSVSVSACLLRASQHPDGNLSSKELDDVQKSSFREARSPSESENEAMTYY